MDFFRSMDHRSSLGIAKMIKLQKIWFLYVQRIFKGNYLMIYYELWEELQIFTIYKRALLNYVKNTAILLMHDKDIYVSLHRKVLKKRNIFC